MGRRYLVLPTIMSLFIICCATDLKAQGLQRQSIGSMGFGGSLSGFYIQESIGQSFFTSSNVKEGYYYNPGFLRPFISVGALPIELNVTAYPNPTSDIVNLSVDQDIAGMQLEVLDIQGRIIHATNISQSQHFTVSTIDWVQGIYFFHLRYKGFISHTTKIIVTH